MPLLRLMARVLCIDILRVCVFFCVFVSSTARDRVWHATQGSETIHSRCPSCSSERGPGCCRFFFLWPRFSLLFTISALPLDGLRPHGCEGRRSSHDFCIPWTATKWLQGGQKEGKAKARRKRRRRRG